MVSAQHPVPSRRFSNAPLFLLPIPKKALSLQENNLGMAITSDRLRQTFSEGGALEVSYYKPAVKGLRAKILGGKYQ